MPGQPTTNGNTNIEVLREMVRLAENRRTEALDMIERVNKYNLGLIAFAGSFLSLLVTAQFPKEAVQLTGAFLLFSIVLSLLSIQPRTVLGSITIDEDITAIRNGQHLPRETYLLDTADVTDRIAARLQEHARKKKKLTIASALALATALFLTYILYAYA